MKQHCVRATSERGGGAVNVQMALLWSAILLLILAVVQVALVYFAGQLALTAAQDGLRQGRYYGSGSPETARRGAEDFLARTGGNTLSKPAVSAELTDNGATMRVAVSAEVLSLVPGVRPTVHKEATGVLERLTP
ncbi:MAG: pilus assembly protein [Acidobacteria bacterium]|nr:pilus assembly protein [Acidobacteriota bacterium]